MVQKVVDNTIYLKRPRRGAVLREEVLGYDNSHDHHHRHFMGKQGSFAFSGYEALAARFYDEVRELWRREDEERRKAH